MNSGAPSGSRQDSEFKDQHLVQLQHGRLNGWGAETVGILAAMGGRAGFLYWLPLLVWAVAAAIVRALAPILSGRSPEYETIAYQGLMWTRMGAVFLIWFGGAQLALALGYLRGSVFRVGVAVTVVVFPTTQLLAELANRLEQVLVRDGSVRVMGVEDSVPGEWTLGNVLDGVFSSAIYSVGFPFALTIVAVMWFAALAQVKRGHLWALLLLPLIPIFSLTLIVITSFEWPNVAAGVVATAVGGTVAFYLVWLGFRRIPVGGEVK